MIIEMDRADMDENYTYIVRCGAPGQQLVIDTGYLAAMTGSCQLEIQTVPGIKNVVFGGEGLFNTVVTGPGRVWLQSMPVSQLAGAIRPFIPTGN